MQKSVDYLLDLSLGPCKVARAEELSQMLLLPDTSQSIQDYGELHKKRIDPLSAPGIEVPSPWILLAQWLGAWLFKS